MDFGLFLLSPQIDHGRSPATVLADTLALAGEAEQIGFDHLWVAEHHFANLSLSPSPLITLSHLAARTSRIRLGSGVLVLPLYHPMRLVEEIAYVDALSEGRLDLGVGGGSQAHESRGLETELGESHARFLESLDILHMAFENGVVEFEGEHFQVPATPMAVRPVQAGGPPVYVAGMSGDERVTRRIAERGYRAFASLFGPAQGPAAAKREEVLSGFDAVGVPRERCSYAGQRVVYVTDEDDDALDAAKELIATMRVVTTLKGGAARFDGHFVDAPPMPEEPTPEALLENTMIGSPARIAEMIEEDREVLGLDHFSCFMQFGGLSRERVVCSMRRFMDEVVPRLH